MKKHFLLLFVFTLLFFNCEPDEEIIQADGDYVTCEINDETFSSSIALGAYYANTLAITGSILGTEEFVNITISNPVEGATYNLQAITDETDVTSITAGLGNDLNYTAGFNYGSGTITLTHFDDDSAAGTFNVIAEFEEGGGSTIEITSGKFSITSFY